MRGCRSLGAGMIGLFLVSVLVAGCNVAPLTVEIPDFWSHHVEGLWVWHRSSSTGSYERVARIAFTSRIDSPSSGPLVAYDVVTSDGATVARVETQLRPVSGNPNGALLTVDFDRGNLHGDFWVSSYNAAGESPRSAAYATF